MKTSQKTKKATGDSDLDIVLEFNDVDTQVIVVPGTYTEAETKRIEDIVAHMSKRIFIDRSYVDFPENKHQDTFIEEEGWRSLCRLLKKTKFGKRSSDTADAIVMESFKQLISAYLYNILEISYGYDLENINIDFISDCKIDVTFYKDSVHEWKYYPGPWQDWGLEK